MAGPALPRWVEPTYSLPNLGAFLHYFSCATLQEQRELCHLYIVEHRDFNGPHLPVRLRLATGAQVSLPTRACHASPCERCSEGRGGYKFCSRDERWTGTECKSQADRVFEGVALDVLQKHKIKHINYRPAAAIHRPAALKYATSPQSYQ